nr:hypothetical protein L204_04700 [Cryptococcus depauperatus CBS 7855]
MEHPRRPWEFPENNQGGFRNSRNPQDPSQSLGGSSSLAQRQSISGNSNTHVHPDSELPQDHTAGWWPDFDNQTAPSAESHAASFQTEQGTADSNTFNMASVPDEMIMDINGVPTVVKVDKESVSKKQDEKRARNAKAGQRHRRKVKKTVGELEAEIIRLTEENTTVRGDLEWSEAERIRLAEELARLTAGNTTASTENATFQAPRNLLPPIQYAVPYASVSDQNTGWQGDPPPTSYAPTGLQPPLRLPLPWESGGSARHPPPDPFLRRPR